MNNMKGLILWKKSYSMPKPLLLSLAFLFSSTILLIGFSTNSVSAFELGAGSALVLIDGHIETSNGRVNAGISGSDLIFPIPQYDTTVNGLYFEFNTSSGLTPDFMFTFNIRYQSEGGQNGWLQLDGVLGQNMDIITLDCVDAHNNAISSSGTVLHVGTQTITCSYLAISRGNYNNFESRLSSRIATFMQPVPDSSKMVVTPGFVRHFNTNGLTEDDRDWLESVLETSNTDVSSIVSTINSQTTTLNNSINSLRSDTQAQTDAIEQGNDNAQSRWEADKQEQSDKQDELEDQAGDLSISAQNPGNPFANLFQTQGCVSMPVFSGWFHRSDVIEVCSPYPSDVRPIIEFVSSVIVVGFLIKIYFKLFKGGYAS